MKTILTIFCAALISCSLSGCIVERAKATAFGKHSIKPSDQIINRTYDIGNFSKLDISNGFKVNYIIEDSETPVVDITMPINYEGFVSVSNITSTLDISTKDPKKQIDTRKIIITVKAPACMAITLSGAVDLTVEGDFNPANKLEMDICGACTATFVGSLRISGALDTEISGASSLTVSSLECDWTSIEASGGSSVNIPKVRINNDARLDASGASKIYISDISSVRRIEADASGASSIEISDMKAGAVMAEASGASDIKMVGDCRDFKKSESGASTVNFKAK